MGNLINTYLINIKTFETIVECKNINCNIDKIKTPNELNKIKEKYEVFKKKDGEFIKKNQNLLKILIELFTKTLENKEYINDIIKYLNEVEKKCNNEYIKYIQDLIQINYNCDESNFKINKNVKNDNNRLLNIIITKYTKYMIDKLKINKKFINIEHKRIYLLNQFLYNSMFNIHVYDVCFNFIDIKKYPFTNKYLISKKIISLNIKITEFNYLSKFKTLDEKDIKIIYKLNEDYINEYCKILKNIVKNKKYIKEYKDFCNILKEKNEKSYTEYIKKIENLLNIDVSSKLIIQFKKSLNILLKICKK